jgi:hypothetical protein
LVAATRFLAVSLFWKKSGLTKILTDKALHPTAADSTRPLTARGIPANTRG